MNNVDALKNKMYRILKKKIFSFIYDMKRNNLFLILLVFVAASCENKELGDEDSCAIDGNANIKVIVNWEDQSNARNMRMNIFSVTDGIIDYGKDNIPPTGQKTIKLVNGASYRPFCYDYNANNIFFWNEDVIESFQAYCPESSRRTYSTLATPVAGEKTFEDPAGDFFVHAWRDTFDVILCDECDEMLIINFYPENKLRQFTYRINNIVGTQYINSARGATSGMAAAYFFHTDKMTTERSTVLFENATIGIDKNGVGYIEGVFYTFGPIAPYSNRFTIELLVNGNDYYTAYWDVSGQIGESMANREAKLARDGYDILISNNTNTDIPEIKDPGGNNGSGGGFEIGVGEWDNVDIYL